MHRKTLLAFTLGLTFSMYGLAAGANDMDNSDILPAINNAESTEAAATKSTAQIADATTTTQKTTKTTTKQKKTSSQSNSVGKMPGRVGDFFAGAVVHIPVQIVKESKRATVSDTQELIGDHKNPLLLVPATLLSVPFGVTTGLFDGVTNNAGHSWKEQ